MGIILVVGARLVQMILEVSSKPNDCMIPFVWARPFGEEGVICRGGCPLGRTLFGEEDSLCTGHFEGLETPFAGERTSFEKDTLWRQGHSLWAVPPPWGATHPQTAPQSGGAGSEARPPSVARPGPLRGGPGEAAGRGGRGSRVHFKGGCSGRRRARRHGRVGAVGSGRGAGGVARRAGGRHPGQLLLRRPAGRLAAPCLAGGRPARQLLPGG